MGDFRKNVSEGEKCVLYELVLLGLHPSVQYPIDRCHVDFAFPEQKLIFEIEGSSHRLEEMQEKDSNRCYYLQINGWKVYPFTEKEAVNDPLNVAAKIKRVLERHQEENRDKVVIDTKKIKDSTANAVNNVTDYVKKTIAKIDIKDKITKNKTYQCSMCGKIIKQRGNCLGCNIRLKKARENREDEIWKRNSEHITSRIRQ